MFIMRVIFYVYTHIYSNIYQYTYVDTHILFRDNFEMKIDETYWTLS